MTELPKTPSMSLNGRNALVTGASSGIGLGCAVALAEAGAHVCLSARNEKHLNKVVKAVQTKAVVLKQWFWIFLILKLRKNQLQLMVL